MVIAVIGPWIAPQNPYDLMQISIMDAKLRPGSESMAGAIYWLGTDGQGRDMLSAMIYGLRTSLAVGLVSGIVALGIGTALGLVAAYYGGRVDTLIMRLVDLMLGFPTILVALMMLALIGQGLGKVMVGAGAGAMGIVCPRRARRRPGGEGQGICRGGDLPRPWQGAHPLRPYVAELPAAAASSSRHCRWRTPSRRRRH